MTDKQLYEWLLNYAQKERPYLEYEYKWKRILELLETTLPWEDEK
jgi:hypothetical protein